MGSAEYVLCGWKGQLWPARVLSRPGTSAHSKRRGAPFLEVQILLMGEKIRVRSTEVRPLTKSEIVTIASSAGKESQGSSFPGQTRAYRRALKVALDILGEGASLLQGGRAGGRRTSTTSPKVPKEQASSSLRQCLQLQGNNQKDQKLSQRSPGKQDHCQGPVLRMGSQKVPAVQGGKAQAHTAVGPPHFEMQGNVLRGIKEGSRYSATAGNAGYNLGMRKLSTSKLRPLSAPTSREGVQAKNEQQAASRPPRCLSTSSKALKQQTGCAGLEIWATGVQGKTTLPENKEDPGPGTLRPAANRATTACMPPIPRLRRSLRIASKKRNIHVPCPQCRFPEMQPQVHSKATNTKFKGRGTGIQEGGQATKVVSAQPPNTIEEGMLVWFKFQDLPFWPAVVKSVSQKDKAARVLLIEGNMQFEHRGVRVPLHKLKHLDCGEKISLMKRASREYRQGISWCFSVIDHYREGLACGSFLGSFMDYYTAQASYPLRRGIQEGELHIDFPKVSYADLEDWEEETALGGKRPHKKLLPDRMRAAWDRANQKLVDFIVKRKGADQHLRDIMKGRKQSKWLDDLWKSRREVFCIETYLEDEDQLHLVARHLQEISKEADEALLSLTRGDNVRFTMEVLLPEAIICSIAALDELSYKEAEEKYLRGPPVHYREKELFNKTILKAARKRSAARASRAPSAPIP
ncbi:PWWP domain-containing DNA repair factor 4 [Psammomys obesus]|uniref:PWWP domain-containing DNA repair factor 4 n=1 Tax=Psammomys obesus TaxID=48139 RepID=UPI002452D925|nr:PWWP domain-containing DNA repair factor 4 [Psammomys obesus]XP_055447784.1 PWWP domain-containing DNA repair factor 4 [Psammomys obesus]